jgi:glutamyl endopeptidase
VATRKGRQTQRISEAHDEDQLEAGQAGVMTLEADDAPDEFEDPVLGSEPSPATRTAASDEGRLEDEDEPDDHDAVSSESARGYANGMRGNGADGEPPATHEGELEDVHGYNEQLLELDQMEAMPELEGAPAVDAWYAEFADPMTLAMALQQPTLTEDVAEVIIGSDDRVRIRNTRATPWRWVCSLRVTAANGTRWIGTGWLVGPRTVITAGHVVYMHNQGGWARRIEVIPGRDGATRPFGSCNATSFRSVKGWTTKKKRSHDYGAIILPSNCRYGDRLGYFGYANLSYFSLLGLKVNNSGYPGDGGKAGSQRETGSQWFMARRIKFVTGRRLIYNMDTVGGNSGGPVWRLKNGKRHVVGIHTNGSPLGNSATRIVKAVFNNIKKWKQAGM